MSRWTSAGVVGGVEADGRLADVVGGALDGQRAVLLDDVLQGGAVHVLHDEEVRLVVVVDVVGADDVGVVEGGDGAGLAVEALDDAGVLGLRGAAAP